MKSAKILTKVSSDLKLSFDECKSRLLTRVDANANVTDANVTDANTTDALLYYSRHCLL
jgi:capsular polysaccharide biosynthesis protein